MRRVLATALFSVVIALAGLVPLHAQSRPPQPVARSWDERNTAAPSTSHRLPHRAAPALLDDSAFAASDDESLHAVIYLDIPSPARLRSQGMATAAVDAQRVLMEAVQRRVEDAVIAQGGQVVYRFTTLSSGLAVILPAKATPQIAALPGVARISPVGVYDLHLSETVPFIGARALQQLGVTGAGVKVAVIDSGVDFTHRALGGPGTLAGYETAYYGDDPGCERIPNNDLDCAYAKPADPALFGPTAPKVKGGYDFLGEQWTPSQRFIFLDANPIDRQGHGTHVADIIAGLGFPAGIDADGPYPAHGPGVAPGAHIYAYKACSTYSSSCEGLALLSALDRAVADGVDIINLSLGSSYGQPEDDVTHFAQEAVAAGVIVVASAGNSGDKPYIVASPSNGAGVISVAQTEVPSAQRTQLRYAADPQFGIINDAVLQPWSVAPGNTAITGTLVYGNGDGTNLLGCAPFTADLSGKVVLVDRGDCNFTAKATYASQAGALFVLIGLTAPGSPFPGGDSGDRPITVPVFMIDQVTASILQGLIADAVRVGFDPTASINLAYTMVGSSARGPRNHDGRIKPDIGAPGASVSAIAGSGSRIGPFGGTSGAAPMVTGTVALIKEKYGDRLSVPQIKVLLMNSATPDIWQNFPGGTLAAITRMGAGQVDAAAAYSTTLIAWDSTESDTTTWTGSLSFGYVAAAVDTAITRTLTLLNLDSETQEVTLQSFFRFADDANAGVVVAPQATTVSIPPGATVLVPVQLRIYPAGDPGATPPLGPLHPWQINRGESGADGNLLTKQEVDGHILITPQHGLPIRVVWQVLPKAVADISVTRDGDETRALLTNASPGVAGITDVFDLVDVSANIHNYTVGDCAGFGLTLGCNQSPVDIKEVGVRAYSTNETADFLEFAVTLHDRPYRAGQYPVEIDIYIDADNDGIEDYVIFNADAAFNEDGRNAIFVMDLVTRRTEELYYVDATFNSQNFILPVDAASVGVTPGAPFGFVVVAAEVYFRGRVWDCSPHINCATPGSPYFTGGLFTFHRYTAGQPRYRISEDDQILHLPADGALTLAWTVPNGGIHASPSQRGLLFLHRNAPVGRESTVLRFDTPLYLPALLR